MSLPSHFHLRILTPDKALVDAQASAVIVPGSEGQFTVLPGHMGFVSSLKEGEISVHVPGTHAQNIRITGGFADVGPDHCIILAEGATVAV
jgi:F-type H+-transporting ATPase subunit epsilon